MPIYDFQKYRRRPKSNVRLATLIADSLLGKGKSVGKAIVIVLLVAAFALTGLSMPSGGKLAGIASVVDGDTIEIRGQRIRFFGIDAPESKQSCTKDGAAYACGREAAFALSDKIGSKSVECEQKDVDRYKRIVAVCAADGVDLNGWMVAEGHARAYTQYSFLYFLSELKAKSDRKGIWAGEFENPWDYRHNH
jgi:endonuclease YncB( thermonuclease family)